MVARIVEFLKDGNAVVENFLKRPAFDDKAEDVARGVLSDIRDNGVDAVLSYVEKFDGAKLSAENLRVSDAEIAAALPLVDDEFKKAVAETKTRIKAFAEAGMKRDWNMDAPRGGTLGEKFVPFDRVGVYVPGGAAPLVSTALMTAYMAKVAGVQNIVACTPMGKNGELNPIMLYGLKEAGVTEIYKVGGIQAIGLMAYGIEGVEKVQKIVGPGGTFVTAAKRQVYGQVALDLVAGPSEIAILADDNANPAFVAADLLSQAEHGSGFEQSLLVTDSMKMAKAVNAELAKQVPLLKRQFALEKVMDNGVLLVVVSDLDAGMDLCNRFAPEHFEIMVDEPEKWLDKVKSAGAVFLGEWTPESVGDFAAGPSHVLPTGGAASMFSGLTVDDFRRRTSFMHYTKEDLQEVLPTVVAFSEVEGLDGHGRSATIRFKRDA
ncbi:MAG: histidinol dehydrogenase [Kiritimatiellae bacterium]|jgi:histidinol dehydrogenase|nr:histidinol dehydrogenase [Kiritimatiellia bacterium]